MATSRGRVPRIAAEGVMAKRVLQVVEEPLPPGAKVVTSMQGAGRPALTGGGRATLLCGACGHVVARHVAPEAVQSLLLQCADCCRFNRV